MRVLLVFLFLASATAAFAQDAEPVSIDDGAYAAFANDGSEAELSDIVSAMETVDVVFLGEQHDDPTGHAIELRLLTEAVEAYGEERPVVLSLEMFESDVQHVLNEYLAGYIRETDFLKATRPWSNYETDYKPLIEFAKEHGIGVIAANAPGRYTSMARRRGLASLDSLSSFARYVLPHDRVNGTVSSAVAVPSEELASKFEDLMAEMGAHGSMPGMPSVAEMLVAQNLRDATMAFWISRRLGPSRPLVIHINGSFHSEDRLGIPEHLSHYAPEATFLTVTMDSVEDITSTPDASVDDFLILTDEGLIPEDED